MSKRNASSTPAAAPEPEVSAPAPVVAAAPEAQAEPPVTDTPKEETVADKNRKPCARYLITEHITPADDKRAPHQYVQGGEYDADAFLNALYAEGSDALVGCEKE